ncbi:hypothetical protein ACIBAG_31630 [Streptomyces sp. NPDC051243]|uniref:hypothetical protein n=1 Tax=Streptomyces sp. NPDC051243 TaxID=3365646 RepID=UPI003791AAC8
MLDDPRPVLVTGDDRAAIYRRADDVGAEAYPDHARWPVLEAYVWCTRRYERLARALWLLLLPFTLINLAHWMRPASRGHERTVRLYGLLVRLAALSLTVLLVAACCEVTLDLAAWQCAASRVCVQEHSWLESLSPGRSGTSWWGQPGRRLALAALAPAALIALLWWLSYRTWSAYESQRPVRGETDTEFEDSALCRPGFWYGRRLVARLRAAHVAAGFLTVAGAVGAPAERYDRVPGGPAALGALGWVFLAALGSGAVVVIWVVCRRGRSESQPDQRVDRLLVRCLPAGALGLLFLTVLYAAWSRPDWHSAGRMPGGAVFGGIALVQCTLVLALGAIGRQLHRAQPDPRTAMRGMAGSALALLSCALGAVLCAGFAQCVGGWLDSDGGSIAGPPVLLAWQSSAVLPLLVLLLALSARLAWRIRLLRRLEMRKVAGDYPGESRDPVRTRRIASKRVRARLIDVAPLAMGVTAVGSLALCAAALVGAVATGKTPGGAAQGLSGLARNAVEASLAVGSWMTVLGLLLFVALGFLAYETPASHRAMGILGDIGAFWPRAAHPLAPPCYAERAVPDLAWRMTTWARSTDGRLVLSAHAQGSVLAAAAIWQLSPLLQARVALQTYGSPLERIYGRWFPAYFGTPALTLLHHSIEGWRNLYRLTDPIGGPIGLPSDQGPLVDREPLMDPLRHGRTADHPLPTPILGNANYQADPAFSEEEQRLLARLRPAVTPTPASSPLAPSQSSGVSAEHPRPPTRPA